MVDDGLEFVDEFDSSLDLTGASDSFARKVSRRKFGGKIDNCHRAFQLGNVVRGRTAAARRIQEGATGKRTGNRPRRTLRAAELPAARRALLHRKYQELLSRHLSKLVGRLFAEFTGLHFHVSWAPAPPQDWEANHLPTACSVCCRLSRRPLLQSCRQCGPQQLGRTLNTREQGRHFTCRLGVRNYWLPIRVREESLGIAYLQALEGATRPGLAQTGRRARAKVMARSDFARASRLLRLLIHHAQTASLAELRKADLLNAGHAVIALEKEQARLRETLKRHLPATPQPQRRPGAESHPERIVRHLLECVDRNYRQPVTLRGCAVKLGMNPAYLSDLFSRVTGVPFKSYLTRFRLEQAKRLLEDPAQSVSDVAIAVGYAGENRFRIAFKKATGLSPRVWRATMELKTAPPA